MGVSLLPERGVSPGPCSAQREWRGEPREVVLWRDAAVHFATMTDIEAVLSGCPFAGGSAATAQRGCAVEVPMEKRGGSAVAALLVGAGLMLHSSAGHGPAPKPAPGAAATSREAASDQGPWLPSREYWASSLQEPPKAVPAPEARVAESAHADGESLDWHVVLKTQNQFGMQFDDRDGLGIAGQSVYYARHPDARGDCHRARSGAQPPCP
jgi:hypothetical protein